MAAVVAPAPIAVKKLATKPKVPATHPKYSEMISEAIGSLKERGGSSRQRILKHILSTYNVGDNEAAVNSRVKLALRAGVKNKTFRQAKGTGASGSFKLGEKPKVEKPKKKAAPKKPKSAAAKAKKPKAKKVAKKPSSNKNKAKKPALKKAKKSTSRSSSKASVKKATKKVNVKKSAKRPSSSKKSAKKPARR